MLKKRSQFAQQRAANVELEDQRRQVQELSSSKKQLQSEIADLKDRLEMEIIAKNEELGMFQLSITVNPEVTLAEGGKRQLQLRLQELEITSSASTTIHSGKLLVIL